MLKQSGKTNWFNGEINGYTVQAKIYENDEDGNQYGIFGTRVSKLHIRKDGAELFNYDRGPDFDVIDDDVLAEIVRECDEVKIQYS